MDSIEYQQDSEAPVEDSQSFVDIADSMADNIATAALRFADAGQDLSTLIAKLIAAGKELELATSLQSKISATSLQAVQDARTAADIAVSAQNDALKAKEAAEEALAKTRAEYGSVSALSAELRKRIAALSVLAADSPGITGAVPYGIEEQVLNKEAA
jgi:hypothetical protein